MEIFSLSFLFFFLPITLFIYWVVPRVYKSFVLFVASLFFFAMSSTTFMLLMFVSLVIDFLLAKQIFLREKSDKLCKLSIYFAAIKNILIVISLSVYTELHLELTVITATVYAFTSLGYLIDLYNDETEPIISFYDYGTFCAFFGKIHVGPIVTANEFIPQLQKPQVSLTSISQGFVWLCHGMAKKVLLADSIRILAEQLRVIPYNQKTVLGVWLLVICNLFHIYFTLSGYSDVARGLGAIFGLSLPENFHYPLQARTVTEFFSRFNISANRYVRKYVYKALGAEDNGKIATTVNILLITMLMGLWYGISINYLVWGALLGIFIVIEPLYGAIFYDKVPAFFRRLWTFVLVIVTFAVFCSNTLTQAGFYLQVMFGMGYPNIFDNQFLYLLVSNIPLLLLCSVFSTDFFTKHTRTVQKKFPLFFRTVSLATNLFMLVCVIAFIK